MSISLPSGLQQILADKRVRRFGVPDNEYEHYLRAETFVIDWRKIDFSEVLETYKSLQEMNLDKPPYERFVLHVITKFRYDANENLIPEYDGIVSFYRFVDIKPRWAWLCEYKETLLQRIEIVKHDPGAQKSFDEIASSARCALYVALITKNIIKERHAARKAQQPINGNPHKKGSGGYTIIRPPEAHEIDGYKSTGKPVRPHFRRGHIRKLDQSDASKWIWVSPCFVNGEPEIQRKAYLVA